VSRPVTIPDRPLCTYVVVADGMQASVVILSDLITIGSFVKGSLIRTQSI
jgi:hypothetical protein